MDAQSRIRDPGCEPIQPHWFTLCVVIKTHRIKNSYTKSVPGEMSVVRVQEVLRTDGQYWLLKTNFILAHDDVIPTYLPRNSAP